MLSYEHTHTHTHVHGHVHAHTHRYTYTHAHTHTQAHTHVHTHMHIHTHSCTRVHTHAHTCMHAQIHTHMPTHMHIIHTPMQTYFYSCTHRKRRRNTNRLLWSEALTQESNTIFTAVGSSYCTRENFGKGRIGEFELFAKIFLTNIHRHTKNVHI